MDSASGKLLLDKASMQEFYQFFADAVAAGVTKKNHIGTDWGQWYNEVANIKAAFGMAAHGTILDTQEEGNDDFFGTIQFTLIPAGNDRGRANTMHPLVYLVTNQNDLQDIASQLVRLLLSRINFCTQLSLLTLVFLNNNQMLDFMQMTNGQQKQLRYFRIS